MRKVQAAVIKAKEKTADTTVAMATVTTLPTPLINNYFPPDQQVCVQSPGSQL